MNIRYKEILKLALPIIIQQFVFQIQGIIDKIFLGKIDFSFISVLGNVTYPLNITYTITVAICTGVTILIGQNYKSEEKVSRYTVVAVKYGLIFGIFLFILWNIISKPLFQVLDVSENLLPMCIDYMFYISFYLIICCVDSALESVALGLGITYPILYASIIKVGINIFLDWILICEPFGIPCFGIKGAAIATTIANSIGTAFLIWYILIYKAIVKIKVKALDVKGIHDCIDILKLGLPAGTELFIVYISLFTITKFLNMLSENEVGIYSLVGSIETLIYILCIGFGTAALSLTSRKMNEAKSQEIKIVFRDCLKLNLLFVCGLSMVFYIMRYHILYLFTDQPSIIAQSSIYLIVMLIGIIPKTANVIIGNSIRAMGNVKWMLATQILGTCIIIFTSYILLFKIGIGTLGVFIVILIDESFRFLLNYIRYHFMTSDVTVKYTSFI